jgi:hypothetical protein
MQVYIVFNDTGRRVQNRNGSIQLWSEPDAVKFCNKHGWKLRGRTIYIRPYGAYPGLLCY